MAKGGSSLGKRYRFLDQRMSKGPARHFAKPMVDQGVLYKCLSCHEDLIQDLGTYELVSRNQATDPGGLMEIIALLESLVKVSATFEVHSGPLRTCLLTLAKDKPSLNTSKFNGQVWANIKTERLVVVMAHCRRLKNDAEMRKAAAKLKSVDYQRLQNLVDKIRDKDEQEEPERMRDDMSLDSEGYHNELKTPPAKKTLTKGKRSAEELEDEEHLPKVNTSFFRKKIGSRAAKSSKAWGQEDEDEGLAKAIGLPKALPKGQAKKRPAATLKKPLTKGTAKMRKPAASCSSGKSPAGVQAEVKPKGQKWHKLKVTYAKKPERAYITAQSAPKEKFRLLVEVSKKRTIQYQRVIETIHQEAEKKGLDKLQCRELRESLC